MQTRATTTRKNKGKGNYKYNRDDLPTEKSVQSVYIYRDLTPKMPGIYQAICERSVCDATTLGECTVYSLVSIKLNFLRHIL